ncbi:decarboxylase [Merismopedia glauca]|uniref:Decarboxylase n=1 Tax=Merismopedia glauca CCAP 1448/3 TaxID=1296344 RepID=A0A2T1BYN6_9CYAN|nr:decarboxylase [Merismopedia glauca]PSB01129.1 decarboxylase [Merismopedia glauca CCAP 1448/3]
MRLNWQQLNDLEREYGDSFYLVDIDKFRGNYQEFIQGFQSIYQNTKIGYSYKTNYLPKLCKLAYGWGAYAEVVSQMEYDLAVKLGVSPNRIIFNGPLKRSNDLTNALLQGSIVNLDSLREVYILKEVAANYPENTFSVGLRCNFDINTDRISRFGFDVTNGDLEDAFTTIKDIDNCTVAGLHCHFSTSHRSVESYRLRTQKLLELVNLFFSNNPPKFINVGGGFFGKMPPELCQQFDGDIPSYQAYAQAIAPQVAAQFTGDNLPELIVEPGVALVADVMQFAAKVIGIKTVRSRQIALLAGSIHNTKPTGSDKKPKIEVYKCDRSTSSDRLSGTIDLVGYTCMEHDCLYQGYQGDIAVGDYVVFDNMGAYTIVFKPPFISPNPAIVSYDSVTNQYELCRRAETMDDVFISYVI